MAETRSTVPVDDVPEVDINMALECDFVDLECCKCSKITEGKTAKKFRGACEHCNHVVADTPGSEDCTCMGLLIRNRVADQPGSGEHVGKGFLVKNPVGCRPLEAKVDILPNGDIFLTFHHDDDIELDGLQLARLVTAINDALNNI